MTVAKLTVSLDEDVVADAREQVAAGRASSISAWLNAAARQYLEQSALEDVLADIFAETGGALRADEIAAARAALEAAESSVKPPKGSGDRR